MILTSCKDIRKTCFLKWWRALISWSLFWCCR